MMAARWSVAALVLLVGCSALAQEICSKCQCTPGTSTLVDCTDKALTAVPNATEWPKDVAIEARFDHNRLVHLTSMGSIPTLEKLSISHCQLTLIDDLAFMHVPNLTYLDLSNNQLTSETLRPQVFRGLYAPDGYEPMRQMRVLHLGYNAIHSLDQDLFEHLTFLTELSLKYNPLSVLDQSTVLAISSLDYLKVLDLSYTGLTTLPMHSLHSPRFLEELHLAGNSFIEIPTQALADTHTLKILTLDDNPIRNLEKGSFPSLPTLEHLSMCSLPNLTVIGAEAFSGMQSLVELIMVDNVHLQYIDPEAFKGQVEGDSWTLRRLHLNGNSLGRLPKELLRRWDALDELRLQGNPWVCDCDSQWILTDLIHILDSMAAPTLVCHEPIEMRGQTFNTLAQNEEHLRCLDLYDHHPEKDGAILIGVLIGVLLAVPITIAIVILWRRFGPSITGRYHASPADYTRAFYKRADVSFSHDNA
ncbi:leucine-rich repeat neuronal protein 2-like [Neocloeon triangulifer]|uniref:leucine-rich repeat neuronal protein 2-like n=1 Tax=Neocloeon triangulifer TaxID=2078957 RepID=UPI00286F77AD|nr:leucine-rich repeat neuronal protein 2-like [Neocloeon triangulifer]